MNFSIHFCAVFYDKKRSIRLVCSYAHVLDSISDGIKILNPVKMYNIIGHYEKNKNKLIIPERRIDSRLSPFLRARFYSFAPKCVREICPVNCLKIRK
jgi:hypothetical protein